MASKIRPLKFGLKYSPPCIILEYQLGEKKRRRVMPVRALAPDSDVHDVVDLLIDAHSQLDPGIVPTEQVVRLVQKLIDNANKSANGSPTHKSPPPNPSQSQPIPQSTQPKIPNGISKDLSKPDTTNGKDHKDNKESPRSPKVLAPITKDTKDIKDNKDVKDNKDNKDIMKAQPTPAPAKPAPIPAKAPPVLGSLSGLSKLGGLPSLQPLSKPPSTAKETTGFRHALDSDEEDDDPLHDDDLDELLDEDKLRKSLSDLDSLDSDNDVPKKGNIREPIKKPAADFSDADSYHSDDDLYNKGDSPLQKKNSALDSPRSGSDDESFGKRGANGQLSGSDGEGSYHDEFLEEVEEEEGNSSGEDLNKLDDGDLNKRKAQMNLSFEKNRKLPGDPGFKYDVQKQFNGIKPSEWDEDEVDDDF